jgi:hypothetical protein
MTLIIAFLIALGVITSPEQATEVLIQQYESCIVVDDIDII